MLQPEYVLKDLLENVVRLHFDLSGHHRSLLVGDSQSSSSICHIDSKKFQISWFLTSLFSLEVSSSALIFRYCSRPYPVTFSFHFRVPLIVLSKRLLIFFNMILTSLPKHFVRRAISVGC